MSLSFNLPKKDLKILAFYTGLVILLRFHAFYIPVIDPDETTQAVIAQAMGRGYRLYTDIWELKPPGIHLLFLLGFSVFGESIFTLRLLGCLTITLSCFLIYKIGQKFHVYGDIIGVFAGIIYAFCSLTSGGLASNIEIFFIPFVLLSFLKVINLPNLESSKYSLTIFSAGLMLGLAFELKYVVIYDIFSILAILILQTYFLKDNSSKISLFTLTKLIIILGIGTLTPFLLVTLFFIINHQFDNYWFANFTVLLIYTDYPRSLGEYIQSLREQFLINPILWLSLFISPIYYYLKKTINFQDKSLLISLYLWLFFILAGIFLTFKAIFFGHYFIQLYPALSLISSYLIVQLLMLLSQTSTFIKTFFLKLNKIKLILIIMFLLVIYPNNFNNLLQGAKFFYIRQIKGVTHWNLPPSQRIANYLKQRTNASDYIYITNYEPTLIYFLSGAKIPTKYLVHTPAATKRFRVFLDPVKEVHEVMKKKPKYVLLSYRKELGDQRYKQTIESYLQRFYVLETTIQGHSIYRSKKPN